MSEDLPTREEARAIMQADLEAKEAAEERKQAAVVHTVEEAVLALKMLEVLPRVEDYLLQLLWCAHSHLIGLFTVAVYLAFRGIKGAGKTSCTAISVRLSRDGVFLADTSDAYLSTVLDEGKTVGIDQADEVLLAHKQGMITSLLRSGYTRGATYGLKEWAPGEGKEKGGWETIDRDLFGPKVFNFHSILEPALLDRTYVIDMDPEVDHRVAVRNMFPDRFLAGVKAFLEAEAKTALDRWTANAVEEMMLSDTFLDELETLPALTGRDYQLGAILLATAKLLDWDLGDLVARLIEGRRTLDEFSDETAVTTVLLERWADGVPFVPTSSLLAFVNDERARTRQGSMNRNRLGEVLKELGFRKKGPGKNWVKRGSSWGVKLDETMAETLEGRQRLEPLEPVGEALDSNSAIGSNGVRGVRKVLARVFQEDLFGVCDFCNTTGHDLLLVGPRGSHDTRKVCPQCLETRFDLQDPPGGREVTEAKNSTLESVRRTAPAGEGEDPRPNGADVDVALALESVGGENKNSESGNSDSQDRRPRGGPHD